MLSRNRAGAPWPLVALSMRQCGACGVCATIDRTPTLLNEADIVIASNESLGCKLHDTYGVTKPLVLWIGHAHDQPAILGLESSRERKMWAGFAFVSQWQLEQFDDAFWVPADKSRVMRNAVAPAFADCAPSEPWFLRHDPPVLAIPASPIRPGCQLNRFPRSVRSDTARGKNLFGFTARHTVRRHDDPGHLCRRCAVTEGVDYVGPILDDACGRAFAMRRSLSLPSWRPPAPRLTSRRTDRARHPPAALPETTAGFASLSSIGLTLQKLAEVLRSWRSTLKRRPESKRSREA